MESGGPVLETGTGTGRFFPDALGKGADIHGIDISPAMLDILKRRLPETEHHRFNGCISRRIIFRLAGLDFQ
ncbi:MAG: class I SAM-dependent methyltransferase [Bacteroidales bacterium]|nr:class I SAM-dependent methyltransferase [Bacteroidales bacterium]